MNNRNWSGFLAWIFFFGVILFICQSMRSVTLERDISYSEFISRLQQGQMKP